jgi:hypothetical protein
MRLTSLAKTTVGGLPGAAEAYQRWFGQGRPPAGGYELERLAAHLPRWILAAQSARDGADSGSMGRRILVVGSLQWWVEHVTAMGLLLAADGHQVDLAYVPYRRWVDPVGGFDLRRQQSYLRQALSPLAGVMQLTDLTASPGDALDAELEASIRRQAELDTQYTLQREATDFEADTETAGLFRLRLQRNRTAASAVHRLLRRRSYDSVVIPNGSILEFGAAYRTARSLGTTAVTYEFGEQRGRMWLAQDDEVMRLRTTALWRARGEAPMEPEELASLDALYQARRGGRPWAQFARQWQTGESQGARAVRQDLGLPEDKKLVLLCTNVVGDSLALDRQLFTDGMADWLVQTAAHLAKRDDCVLVVRVHPGELLGAGHPSREILHNSLPDLADRVVIIPPESDVNTYDLIDLAHVGLVYTTTVGMEMAMAGVPVVVAGDTHYRGKGFTVDPDKMATYLDDIDRLVSDPPGRRLPQDQIEAAVRYAYRFFFEFPFAYPWHIVSFWDDMGGLPLEDAVQPENRRRYSETLAALSGLPIDWPARRAEAIPEAA